MALVLALKKGQSFYIGNQELRVVDVVSEVDFMVEDVVTGKRHRVTDAKSIEIFEDVLLSAGDRQQLALARVAIEAPREVRILRDEVYQRELQKGTAPKDAPKRV